MSGFNGTIASMTMAALAGLATAAQAQDRLYPLVAATQVQLSDDSYVFQCLLGAATGQGAFVAAEDAAPRITASAPIGWYNLGGALTTGTTYPPEQMDGPCEYASTTNADGVPDAGGSYVGVAGGWAVMPGLLRLHSPQSETYRAAAAAYFAAIGHATNSITLRQVIRTDFEGDGVEEVVLTVTDYAEPDLPVTNPGDHSVILVRRLVNGVVQTAVVDGDIHDTREDFAAPLEFAVIAIADLNGDGVAEIVGTADYYEGSSFAVYRIDGAEPALALTCGCGA